MRETIEKVVKIVQSSPMQVITWDDVKSELTDRERTLMFPAVRQAQNEGLLQRKLEKVGGQDGLTLLLKGVDV